MIKITGSIKRSFIFPAAAAETLAYYQDIQRIVQFLPHITLTNTYNNEQIRVKYESLELGTYTIRIFSDLECAFNDEALTINVYPIKLPDAEPIQSVATVRETSGHGLFAIDAQFAPLGNQTRVEYQIRMQGQLERPAAMKLMPRRVVNKIAHSITETRIREIADGFIKESVAAFNAAQQNRQTN
jgi:hypothetical protein